MKIREQIAEVNNFAGRSLSVKEHDAWKDIKASMEAMLEVVMAAKDYVEAVDKSLQMGPVSCAHVFQERLAKLEGQL